MCVYVRVIYCNTKALRNILVLNYILYAVMASPSSFGSVVLIISILVFAGSSMVAFAGDFWQDVDLTWGGDRAKLLDNGQLLTLSLDRVCGSGFQSKNTYLFGKTSMQIKLVPGNSAGTVTTYYMRSDGVQWDEIDFEFLGNLSGDPYTLHTNIYSEGKDGREQQFRLWFDPASDFHTYSILWTPEQIIFYVDETPIRVFGNLESRGVPFPKNQQMRIYSSIWAADEWATRGGLVKIDWSQAPFTSSYRNFGVSATSSSQVLDLESQRKLHWVRENYMIYNYCTDTKRFPEGLPPECSVTGL